MPKNCFFVPVLNHVLTIGQDLFSIKTKKLERKDRIIEENTFKDLVPEIYGLYITDNFERS
jgi:hypothetical protein